jgi:putative transposase
MPMHLVQRGINREPCFCAEENYHCYLHWLQKSAADWGCAIHAYVLMTNHVHLLITPQRADGPARLMQSLGRRYVQYINRAYKRSGSLWEGRYKSSVVQAETYLFACMRYMELNPVRAGMASDPAHYRWSSYRHNGLGPADERLVEHLLYQGLDIDPEQRQAIYRALFRSELDDDAIGDIRLALTQSQPLGDDCFAERICAKVGVRRAHQRRGRPPRNMPSDGTMEEQAGFSF